MVTKDAFGAELLNLVLQVSPSGFYYKDLRQGNLQDWGELIPQQDDLILRIHVSQFSNVIGNLIEYGLGPGMPAAVFLSSGFPPMFGRVSDLPTKLKGLPEQDLVIVIHEAAEQIKS